MSEQWEVRSKLRWGSQHETFFNTKEDAVGFAMNAVAAKGGVGRIEAIVGHVVYYDEYEEDL